MSEERETFETGCVRDTKGKSAVELISPLTLLELGNHLEENKARYPARNWEKGMPIMIIVASLLRHTYKFMMKYNDENHACAIFCNAMFLLHTIRKIENKELPESLDNR